jgi:hypothetical protein
MPTFVVDLGIVTHLCSFARGKVDTNEVDAAKMIRKCKGETGRDAQFFLSWLLSDKIALGNPNISQSLSP